MIKETGITGKKEGERGEGRVGEEKKRKKRKVKVRFLETNQFA